jgi:hypothetical protein
MGRTMKTLWIGGLLCLLAIVAYSRMSITASDAGELKSAAANPLPGVIALDMSSSGARDPAQSAAAPAPGSANADNHAAEDLSAYVFLHNTRSESTNVQVAARANSCPE